MANESNNRFFRKADEVQQSLQEPEPELRFEVLLDQLTMEFAMLCDEFRIMPDEERNSEQVHDLEMNAKHVYFRVGLNLTERMLNLDEVQDISCAQQQPIDVDQLEQADQGAGDGDNKEMPQLVPLLVDPENASAPQKPDQLVFGNFDGQGRMGGEERKNSPEFVACGADAPCNIVKPPFAVYTQIFEPIFGLTKRDKQTAQGLNQVVEAIRAWPIRLTIRWN